MWPTAGLTENGTTNVTRPRVVLAEDHPAMATERKELLNADHDILEVVADGASLIESARGFTPA